MVRDWEQLFRNWSGPSSDSEEAKCQNASRMISEAVREGDFSRHSVRAQAQGSYRNNTNVRLDSDVDIRATCTDLTILDFSQAPHLNMQAVRFTASNYTFAQYKQDIGRALVQKFGAAGVTPGSKAFNVHANTYRVDADVVPTFVLRRYNKEGTYNEGTYILSDNGQIIHNFPEQQYTNGVAKNQATGYRFKQITRAFKRLRNEMKDAKIEAANPMASFLLECLTYNTPDSQLRGDSYKTNIRNVIIAGFDATKSETDGTDWVEVSGLKWLFGSHQGWTRSQINTFMQAAWNYVGFE